MSNISFRRRGVWWVLATIALGCGAPPPPETATGGEGDQPAAGAEGGRGGVGTGGRHGGRGGEAAVPRVEPQTDPLTDLPMVPVPSRADAPSRGPEGAPLQVVVFTDYECPFCRRHDVTLRHLQEHYGERMRVTVRQFPLPMHPMAHAAAEAAMAAHAEGKFWTYHELLFSDDRTGPLSPEDLRRFAQRSGLDMARFARAQESGFFAGSVDKDVRSGTAIGVTGTPATFLNGRMVSGARPLEDLIDICDRLLGAG